MQYFKFLSDNSRKTRKEKLGNTVTQFIYNQSNIGWSKFAAGPLAINSCSIQAAKFPTAERGGTREVSGNICS